MCVGSYKTAFGILWCHMECHEAQVHTLGNAFLLVWDPSQVNPGWLLVCTMRDVPIAFNSCCIFFHAMRLSLSDPWEYHTLVGAPLLEDEKINELPCISSNIAGRGHPRTSIEGQGYSWNVWNITGHSGTPEVQRHSGALGVSRDMLALNHNSQMQRSAPRCPLLCWRQQDSIGGFSLRL